MDKPSTPDTGRASPTAPGTKSPQSETASAQGESQRAVPRMPHERDESASSTQPRAEPSQERVGAVAHADAERGLADTSKATETDETYDRLRADMPAEEREKRFTP